MTQRVGHPLGVRHVQLRDVAEQMGHAFVPGEDVHLQRLGGMRPGLVPRGDDDVPGAGGQVRLELLGVVGIVEDEQPVRGGVAAQLLQRGLGRFGHVVADLQAHLAGQVGERPADLLGPLRWHPPDEVVVGHEAVRVLQRELGLAHAAQPVQRLGDHDGPAAAG